MATVRQICSDALVEINVVSATETPSAPDIMLALRYFQRQLDAWAADPLTNSAQLRTTITWPASTSTQTVGPSGNINIERPVWINAINYVVPSSSPEVEVPIGPMDRDSYAAQSIKALTSALPLAFFYQTNIDDVLGSLFLWPQPDQQLTLYLYNPQAVAVPASLNDVLLSPVGYLEAFHYQLAMRLCGGFQRPVPPLLPGLAQQAFMVMKRPNIQPGLLGIDAALVPSTGGSYNILSDQNTGYTR